MVGVDEDTVKRFPEPITLWHRHLGQFMAAMAQARPAVVGMDIVLPDRSYEAVLPGTDKLLMRGLLEARRGYPLVLALTVDPTGRTRTIHPPFVALAGTGGTGYALFPTEDDGMVRRFDEHLPGASAPVPTLAGQMARHLKVEPRAGLIDYWRGAPFDYIPLQQVLQWSDARDEPALARAFRDKAVLLGTMFRFEDRQLAPVQLAARDPGAPNTPGVLLHAQALRNLLGGGLIQRVPAAAIAALAAGAALLWLVSVSTAAAVAIFAAIAALLFAASTWLLTQGWFAPVLAPLAASALALGGRNAWDTLLKLRERRRLRGSFSGYVSPSVMEEILAGRINPGMGGQKQFVCVMFSDIRGYTTRGEGMAPQTLIEFLNRYYEQVVQLIHARGGSVVSFMGDGIVAMFGAPKPLDHPCAEAFAAACEMLDYVQHFNANLRAAGEAPIEIGIGLHGGEAVVGHVGATSRHDYTVIGDVANVASRLEGLTKEVGYRLVCSKVVAELLPRVDVVIPLGQLSIKGHAPVEAHGYDKVLKGHTIRVVR